MIANLINTLLGLALVYVAVLDLRLLAGRVWPMAILAVIVFVLALASRRGDVQRWQSNTNMVMAVALLLLSGLQLEPYPYVTFWGLFWIGIVVGVLALWSVIQRLTPSESAGS
jgi:hypothetical protein